MPCAQADVLSVDQLRSSLLPPVSLQLEAGECIMLRGASGSGKTLMLRAIADLDVNSASIRLDGRARETIPANIWRRQVTYLPAESHWWSEYVADHFSHTDIDWQSLALPADIASWTVNRLSSGERQRLALLRAMARAPRVLLLDEVTANLDADNTQRVEHLIKSYLQRGNGIIWVSHDPQQAQRMADHLYELTESGLHRIQDHGTG